MRGEPVQHLIRRGAFGAWRQVRTVDHQNRNVQRAGRMDFGNRPLPAGIFADQQLDPLILEEFQIVFQRKGAACHGDRVMWHQRRHVGRINDAQNVVMLRLGRESVHVQAPKGQHDALCGSRQSGNRAVDIRHMFPTVQRVSLPRWSGKRRKGRVCLGAGFVGVPAHLRGKGMGGVDHMGEGVLPDVGRQAFWAAKAPFAGRQRLRFGAAHASCIAEGGTQPLIGYGLRKGAGLGCAAKNKEMLRRV